MSAVRVRFALLFPVLTLSFSCGGGGGTTAPPGPVASVTVSPAAARIGVGASRQLAVSVKDSRGRELENEPVLWSSSAPGVVAVADGTVSGLASGQAMVTAEADGIRGSASVVVLPRSAVDRPDDLAGAQVHLLYVLPADGHDRSLDIDGPLIHTVETVQLWLAGQTGGRRLRFDTSDGLLDLSFIRLDQTEAEIAADPAGVAAALDRVLTELGHGDREKAYVVYYDAAAPGPCSQDFGAEAVARTLFVLGNCAHVPFPEAPSAELRIASGEWHLIHDLLHALGYVGEGAPNGRERHTTDDPRDLLNYLNGPTETPILLDVGRDDYYGPNVPTGVLNLAESPFLTP